nr:GNAT family N-acetyltransferase [Hoyosella altamirensis]
MGLFPALGVRFLRQWHKTVLAAPHGVLLVAVDRADGAYGGFLLGSTDHLTHTDALLRAWRSFFALALTGAVALLRNPSLAAEFARTRAVRWTRRIARAFVRSSRTAHGGSPQTAVLAGVAVFPGFRERGVGAALVNEFLKQCATDGAEVAELITDLQNENAARFYELLDWVPAGDSVTRDGNPIRLYRYFLNGGGTLPYRDRQ